MQNLTVTIAPIAKKLPREIAGVYLLFYGRSLDYVGQSDHVRRRLVNEHHVYDPAVHHLVALIHAASYEDRLALERYFNQKYNPANSLIGSGKQAASFDSRFLRLTAEQRRKMWVGPAFDEFDLPKGYGDNFQPYQLTIPAAKLSLNHFDVPSILSLPPEELLG
jgi:hypothetical protein